MNVYYDLRSLIQRVSTSTTINTIYGYRYGKHVKIKALVTVGSSKTDADGILIIDPSYIPSKTTSQYVGTVQIRASGGTWDDPSWPAWVKKMTFGSTEYTTFGQGITGQVAANSKILFDLDFIIQD